MRTPINFLNEVKVNFDKRMNSLCFSNQPVFSISMQYRMHMLQTIRTNSFMVYCIVQFVNCMKYVIYMPHNFFMNASTILRKKFYMSIHSPSVFAFFKFDEFYISKGAISIPFTICLHFCFFIYDSMNGVLF